MGTTELEGKRQRDHGNCTVGEAEKHWCPIFFPVVPLEEGRGVSSRAEAP